MTAVTDLVEGLHDRAGVPLTAHARQLHRWAEHTGQPLTTVLVDDAPGASDDEGAPSAAALLGTRTWRTPLGPVVSARLAGHGWSDEQRLVARDAEAADRLAAAILERLDQARAWRLELEQLPAGDPVARAFARRHRVTRIETGDPLPRVVWPDERTETTWAGKKTRQKARRTAALADERGQRWEVTRLADRDEILAALPATLALRTERELDLDRADDLARDELARLHEELVATFAGEGRAELWQLHVDGELEIYLLAVRDGDAMRMLDSRMRPAPRTSQPGMLLFSHALRTWHADPSVREVDLGRGRNDFKRQIRTDERETERLLAWSHPAVAALDTGAHDLAETARAGMRRLRDRSELAHRAVRAGRRAQTWLRTREEVGR